MNKSTHTHLKIMVERVVRPVPAGTARKRRMREELLAHVTAVFEEEAARLGDVQAALKRTEERFGNPDELTGQLLKSVPAKDFSDRFMAAIVLLTVIWLALFGAAEFAVLSGPSLVQSCLFVVGVIYLADLLRRTLNRPVGRSGRRAISIAAFSMLLFVGLLFLVFECSFDAGSKPNDLTNIFMLTAALTWGVMTPLLETIARVQSQMEWESLQID